MSEPTAQTPIADTAYDALAERYAARINAQPYNALYERPAFRALIPPVEGLRVLDAGCGTGHTTAWLLDRGAHVVGVEVNPSMLAHARASLGDRAELHAADLRAPLDFLPTASFDLVVSSLVMHYLPELAGPFRELARVLKPGGRLIFSTHHPFRDWARHATQGAIYLRQEPRSYTWSAWGGEPVEVPFYRRPLSDISEALAGAGFVIERLVEPRPLAEMQNADPKAYAELNRMPSFVCFAARKDGAPSISAG